MFRSVFYSFLLVSWTLQGIMGPAGEPVSGPVWGTSFSLTQLWALASVQWLFCLNNTFCSVLILRHTFQRSITSVSRVVSSCAPLRVRNKATARRPSVPADSQRRVWRAARRTLNARLWRNAAPTDAVTPARCQRISIRVRTLITILIF